MLSGYEQIGKEILKQVDQPIDAYCGGVGTAGMLMGVVRAFRNANSSARIVALEPAHIRHSFNRSRRNAPG